MIPIKSESTWKGTADCRICDIRDLVLFSSLSEEDFDHIHAPVDRLEFPIGTRLFQEGGNAVGAFTLRSGRVKLVRSTADGRERIVRVLRPGDVIGLEALVHAKYDSDAVALTEVAVCRLPLAVLHALQTMSPRLHQSLMHKWSTALKEAQDWLVDLNFGTARNRVSNLILKMRDPNNPELVTLFAREDMGAMTDLKMETVSREISALVREGTIQPLDKQGRLYRIVQKNHLENASMA